MIGISYEAIDYMNSEGYYVKFDLISSYKSQVLMW